MLDNLIGSEVWVKRDDITSGAEAGNKIRKLEYLLAAARQSGSDTVITCGGAQSNHARATAICARQLGMKCILLLRVQSPAQQESRGNLFLDRMVGADVRFITPEQYRERDALMTDLAVELAGRGNRSYIIPEGGSNGLGALGYVDAALELGEQVALGLAGSPEPFDWVVCACGSGGTAAGLALGCRNYLVANEVHAMAVCDDVAYFEKVSARIIAEARSIDTSLSEPCPLVIEDRFKGPAYGVMSDDQKAFLLEVAANTGLVLDPVYSGKALFGLAKLESKPARICFIHTGGLPGLLAQAADFTERLS
jgi:D-cysteine desulfhydrase